MPSPPILVVEDDPFTRIVALVLDRKASPERRAAYADFFACTVNVSRADVVDRTACSRH